MLMTLVRLWQTDFSMFDILFVLLSYAALVFVSLPIHEAAHAFSAYKLGDNTAKWYGRLSLNPLKHLDKFGTLMLLLCGIGYAKPVPVNPNYFKNPKRGMALTALAGPVSNVLMAMLALGIYRLISLICGGAMCLPVGTTLQYMGSPEYMYVMYYAYVFLVDIFASVNIGLAVYNLLPLPPLDGSRIFSVFLPDKYVYAMERYQQYISLVLMVLILTGALDGVLTTLCSGFGFVICTLFGMPNVL